MYILCVLQTRRWTETYFIIQHDTKLDMGATHFRHVTVFTMITVYNFKKSEWLVRRGKLHVLILIGEGGDHAGLSGGNSDKSLRFRKSTYSLYHFWRRE